LDYFSQIWENQCEEWNQTISSHIISLYTLQLKLSRTVVLFSVNNYSNYIMEASISVILVLALLLLLIFTFKLVRYYAHEDLPVVVSLAVFISWYFGFSLCILLPFDLLAESEAYKDNLKFGWDLIYWFRYINRVI